MSIDADVKAFGDRFEAIAKRIAADPDHERKVQERIQADKDAENRRMMTELWGESDAPKRHRLATIQTDGPWFDKFESLKSKLGTGFLVALVGGRGSGKTQMAVSLMRAMIEQHKRTRFLSAVSFFMLIKSTYKRDAEDDEAQVMRELCQPALLVIDEIGKRSETEWENSMLFELLNRRYNDMRDTVVIDNRSAKDFTETIGPSLASRMHETGGIITCDWPSFRA